MVPVTTPRRVVDGGGPVAALPWLRVSAYWLAAYRRTWFGSAFSDFLSPLLFLAGLGFGLGSLVDSGSGAGALAGVPYAAFVAPGVMAAQAMQSAVGETTFPVMGALKWNRAYHAMLDTPLTTADVVTGHLAWVAARLVVTTTVFALVATALGAVASPWVVAAVAVAVLTGTAFAALTYAVATRSESDQAFNLLVRFVVLPLFLFSGVFFPLDQLPAPLQWVGWATPLWHGVDACRSLALGTAELVPVLGHVAVLVGYLVLGVVLARLGLRSRMVT